MTKHRTSPTRRHVIAALGLTGVGAVAGCLGDGDTDDSGDDLTFDSDEIPTFPVVDDPPDAVYVPTHYEGMVMPGPVAVDDLMVGPMLTYPHQFWIVTGDEAERVEPSEDDDVHLMVTAWDSETEAVLPVDTGVSLEIYQEDEHVSSNTPWLMISQEMGFHFGDNVPLDGDGHYRVEGTIPALDVDRTGEFENRFTESYEFSFEFHFDDDARQQMVGGVEYLSEEEWGELGALTPMHERHGGHHHDEHDHNHDSHDHHVPYSSVPSADELPGTLQEIHHSGDAEIVTTVFSPESRFSDAEWYVAVSPRTPYNRSVLPMMQLDGIAYFDTEEIEQPLRATLDHELGLHYGAPYPDLESTDQFQIEFIAPPQVSRHQGYERAFLDMDAVTIDLAL